MTEFWTSLGATSITLLVGLISAYVAHRLTSQRERRSKIKTERIELLTTANRRLMAAASRPFPMSDDQAESLESAISDILFLGNDEEIEEAQAFMNNMARGEGATLNPLINALRNSVRRELCLSERELPNPLVLRITRRK